MDCGSVALDDITMSLGDCELATGNIYSGGTFFFFWNEPKSGRMYSKHSCVTQTFDGMRAATQKKKQNKKKTTARQVDLNCDIFLAAGMSSPLPGCCDFAAGLCGYTQDKQSDAADWEWRRGPTPTSYTGPRGDHTSGLGETTTKSPPPPEIVNVSST